MFKARTFRSIGLVWAGGVTRRGPPTRERGHFHLRVDVYLSFLDISERATNLDAGKTVV